MTARKLLAPRPSPYGAIHEHAAKTSRTPTVPAMKKQTPRKRLIAREAWDFNVHPNYEGCPEAELPHCFIYEFARESPSTREKVAQFRKHEDWPQMFTDDNFAWRRGFPTLAV
jgi:hypothetical protein